MPELPQEIQVPYGQDVSAFANVAYIHKPGEMVYIDFAQVDVAAPSPPGHGSIVARVVIHPGLAADLVTGLSKRLASTEED